MPLSFYKMTVSSYLQGLGGIANAMAKGEAHAAAGHFSLHEITGYQLHDDMAPFTATNFVMAFSLSNVYFHAATLNDVLRTHDVPLGKLAAALLP